MPPTRLIGIPTLESLIAHIACWSFVAGFAFGAGAAAAVTTAFVL